MMKDYNLENRRFIIGGIAITIVTVYIIRLFTLQLLSDDYKKNADSNAFLKKIEYPSRGIINDRNGELLVYNQPAYDVMVIMNEAKDKIDTTEFCQALGITKEFFIKRMETIKDRNLNPGYSRFTQQLFMNQFSWIVCGRRHHTKDFARRRLYRYDTSYLSFEESLTKSL